MPLDVSTVASGQVIQAAHVYQFYNLLTGAMTDQAVSLKNQVSVGGSHGTGVVPLVVNGASGQTADLLQVKNFGGTTVFGVSAAGAIMGGLTVSAGTVNFAGATVLANLPTASNVLGADVALNNTATYFTGPSMAQGTAGTWLVVAGITYQANAGDELYFRLTDGTSIFAGTNIHQATGASGGAQVHLSAIVAAPVANLRVTVKNGTNTVNSKIAFNFSGDSKDSYIWGVRIA